MTINFIALQKSFLNEKKFFANRVFFRLIYFQLNFIFDKKGKDQESILNTSLFWLFRSDGIDC